MAVSAPDLIAIDLALLLPVEVNARAEAINAALRTQHPNGFRLDEAHLPHITLVQRFLKRANLPVLFGRVEDVLRGVPPLALRVTSVGRIHTSLHFAIHPAPGLQRLHEKLMTAVQPVEESAGAADAFCPDGEAARRADVEWVTHYRAQASDARYSPHITLGVGQQAELGDPFDFTASRTAICHLGRFCTCRIVLREWTLAGC